MRKAPNLTHPVSKLLQATILGNVWLPFGTATDAPIDRKALVTRHSVVLSSFSSQRPMQVGNGEFAFSFDITGLQTFTSFNTMSNWGWNSSPLPQGTSANQFQGQTWITNGRPVRYPMPDPNHPQLSQWLTANPHRINLGRVGLLLSKRDGSTVVPADLRSLCQTLDLWSGVAVSRFELEGNPVMVKTVCDPKQNAIGCQIFSPLIKEGRLAVLFAIPGDAPRRFANYVGDWANPIPLLLGNSTGDNSAIITRTTDPPGHTIELNWEGAAHLTLPKSKHLDLKVLKAEYGVEKQWADVTTFISSAIKSNQMSLRVGEDLPDPAPGKGKSLRVTYALGEVAQVVEAAENSNLEISGNSESNRVVLTPMRESDSLSFICSFAAKPSALREPKSVFSAARAFWPKYWESGGAIDLSGSTDPRWKELERRIVLSQYLMRINEAGSLPPQESGLTNNGWYGRFHMEMIWWHGAHWALWNRWSELNTYLGIYRRLLPSATSLASGQGYQGARWPKCLGPNLQEWPDEIHALLIWQQPHPLFFAELDYRAHPSVETLQKWKPIVEATADFMATYAHCDLNRDKYVLGPPLVPVSENVDSKSNQNPTFELGYWRFGLRIANEWRKRLHQEPNPTWLRVSQELAPLPQAEGLYVLNEGIRDMWTKFNFEHPAIAGSFGMLPGDGVERDVMRRTFNKILTTWRFDQVWGWDFPMLAMCAARLGEPEFAIDMLLHNSEDFQFDEVGLASGGPYPYFPSNGGLLYAAAMMAVGWDGATTQHAPGFPTRGWRIRYDGLSTAP